ncbi:bifunctional protein tRNA sulfurtransferase thii and cysteine sulfinate desulfinase/cysteine desulfurase domain [Fadolivirus algeromassiliense]|jgi:adenylyl- and sulfurtransferase ThiI/cysteine sulfinate desulfinase/cysteine desulfurase-like protein|uniref:NifS-like protein n=1 Tax=Fadolivirus FV1/VV64 TaxID=3070911 RepID=A0A7D3QUL2_9VIRU|nr:bifunctional protein tRNA sulfurtransferase thii and cysteine sulfinate desulfinase/cysteine desulfurase domain [Fadolivirus algeromassiliense]QKF94225.1 bifunctional protein tRNA sulfurtransferase thii and cysteine sulfinate desulfinase/cysteine desulfurase domain [Fadolivirus FV1/VV64]
MSNFDQVANPDLIIVSDIIINNYNPNSNHKLGKNAKSIILDTKNNILSKFPQYKYCYFVPGGGTLANKRSIFGSIQYKPKRIDKEIFLDKIIISSIEHKSINEVILNELVNRGYTVIKIPVTKDGVVDLNILHDTIEKYKDTIALVSIMNVNNETGIIQPINKIYNIIKNTNKNILFHSDICQGIGLLYRQLSEYPDIVSFSTYKLGGPHLGVVLSNYQIEEEYTGTEDTYSIQLFGHVFEKYFKKSEDDDNVTKISMIKNKIKQSMIDISNKLGIDIIDISQNQSVNFIQSFLLPQSYETKTIQGLLSEKNIYIGTGSACSSQSNKGSHVIESMGYTSQTYSLLRFSYNETITENDIYNMSVQLYNILLNLKKIVKDMQEISDNVNKIIIFKEHNNDKKEYNRLNLPLDIQILPIKYDYVKLSVGELYLKGNNKQYYFDKLKDNIMKSLHIIKKNMMIKENIIIINNINKNSVSEFMEVFGIAKISLCDVIKRSDNDLMNLTALTCSMISNYLAERSLCTFRLTIDYNRINKFNNLSNNQLAVELGQYIRERFGDKVLVNLKNYDMNIIINIYNDIIIITSESQTYKGPGGLPTGTSGSGICIINNGNLKRSLVSAHMSGTRGSDITFISLDSCDNFNTLIDEYDYVIIESNIYNDDTLYYNLNTLEKIYSKPFITNTNVLSDDEIDKYINKFHLKFKFNGMVSSVQIFDLMKMKKIKTKNVLMLLSGGIDSPVASHLLIRSNYNIDYIHFTTDIDKLDNIIQIRKVLGNNGKLFVVQFKELQNEIVKTCDESYRTIMYKVFMILIANKMAKNKYDAIATGNSLGQVASQTIENIRSTNLISELPIICPLFGYNKDDTIEISRKIGTYIPSTCDGTNDCCIMYMPKHPIIRSNYNIILKNISKIDSKFVDEINIIEY